VNNKTCKLMLLPAALLVTGIATAASAAPNLEPGEWKITAQTDTSKTSLPGLPGLKIPPQPPMTYNWCYKPEPGKDMGQNLADSANRNQAGAKCEMLENKSGGNSVHYKMQCASKQGSATITGDFIIDGKKYGGKTHIDLQSPVGPMQMDSTISGEYLGPCKTPAAK
jgi:hypothetical protein